MKYIQPFISDGMSMNSLKPSINSEPESSLDSCIMKEASVDDCILSKEIHAQNNGEKELSLTDYDIKNAGNATKKMFEQVDLNSSVTNTEITMKKDSWSSEVLYDNTSEKENMRESNDLRFDTLSDDDNESIHLKISSDDDNSVGEPDTDDQRTSSNLQNIVMENISPDKRECENDAEIEGAFEGSSNTSSSGSKSNGEEVTDTLSSEKNADLLKCSDKTDGKTTQGIESDDSEEIEPLPSSESPQLSLNDCDNTDMMVSEVKSPPTSPKHFSPKSNIETSEAKLESFESVVENDQHMSTNCSRETPDCETSPKNSVSNIAELDHFENSPKEVDTQGEKNGDGLNHNNVGESMEKENIISDDAIDSDNCVDNIAVNGLEICDEPEKSEEEEESYNESLEEETCNQEVDEVEYEDRQSDSPNSVEGDDSMKEGRLNEDDEIECKSSEGLTVKDCSSEQKFLEILEYQPSQDEGEEINSNKEILSDENEPKTDMDESIDEPSESVLCSEEEIEKDKMINDENEQHSPDCKISDPKECIASDEESSKRLELRKLESSDDLCCNDTAVHEVEDDVKLLSEVPCGGTDSLAESCEAPSGRKRTSSREENLVNCSKRTKVVKTNSDPNDCDIFVCENTEESEQKTKCTEVDTKEKCDTRSKRLSSSISYDVEVKKIRVMPEPPNSEKEERINKADDTGEKLKRLNSIEKSTDLKKDNESSGDVKLKSFLRYCTREQFNTMTRNDLEELIIQKICEAIAERSQCGVLRETAQSLEEKLKMWQKKALQLSKQVKDLNVVLRRFGSDLSKSPNAVPVKITRSVGLQVQIPSSSSWHPDENSRRKGEKSSSTPTSASSASTTNSVKATASSAAKPSSSSPKISETAETTGTTAVSPRQNSQTNVQTAGVKVAQTRSPATPNSGPAVANKTSSKAPQSSVTNRTPQISSSEHQVIDLTDPEEKTKKNSTNRVAPVSNPAVTTVTSVTTTAIASSVNAVASMGIASVGRSIRVVQHLGGANAPILTQSGANAVAGQRVAYFVPSTSVPVQPRQLIISSPSQVRPAGVVSMSQRQNPLPTIVLKPGQVVPVSPVTATAAGTNIIRTSTINNSIQLTGPRLQPRPGQLIQRLPINANAVQSSALTVVQSAGLSVSSVSQHPAPLPPVPTVPSNPSWKLPPPKPDLKISKVPNRNQQGIVLSWNMTVTNEYEEIASYQLFAYQEGSVPPNTQLWKKVGDVKALPLPMACTLTQFMEGHKYHFAVRAVDIHARYGPFSAPGNIVLTRN